MTSPTEQGHVLRALISESKLVDDHTVYRVELWAGQTKCSSVERRFREFTELYTQLNKAPHTFSIPSVPPKKFFGNTDPAFVRKRQADLQVFLDKLVQRIVDNAPSEAAWGLLCRFMALDPRQYVPEAILAQADQATSRTRPSNSGTGGAELSGSFDSNAVSNIINNADTEADQQSEAQTIDMKEARRMEGVVDSFGLQVIQVTRRTDDRLQSSNAFTSAVNLQALRASIKTHILSKPLVEEGTQAEEDDKETSELNYPPLQTGDEFFVALE
mmetsp:Transcript_23059/g.43054  ORF Transcript_23059/g.43054 Transcript_23059/m.43054 type:complete len:272 (+) Transcript_23059:279-1094(+)